MTGEQLYVKICDFGKALDIKDIIVSVEYKKGKHNDKGDESDDYVIIKLRDNNDVC